MIYDSAGAGPISDQPKQSAGNVSPFIRKLRHGPRMMEADEALLTKIAGQPRRADRGDIAAEGSQMRSIVLVVHGWICRYQQLENGKRQITSIFLPGDLCEPFGALQLPMDSTLAALTPAFFCTIPARGLRAAAKSNPRIEEALWWDLLLADSLNREHLLSLGRRSATERLGHFFCEVHCRLEMVGLADRSSCEFPLTQIDLADLFGLSVVHVNRSIQELRGLGLLSLRERRMTIHHPGPLRELAMFDPAYLACTRAHPLSSAPPPSMEHP